MSADTPASVQIPGTFTARVELRPYPVNPDAPEEGTDVRLEVVGFTFSPAASFAGYFGPAAVGDGLLGLIDPALDEDGLEDPDGPFWSAIRRAIETQTVIPIDDTVDGGLSEDDLVVWKVPVAWEE